MMLPTRASLTVERDGQLIDVTVEGVWVPGYAQTWEEPGYPAGWEGVEASDVFGQPVTLTRAERVQALAALDYRRDAEMEREFDHEDVRARWRKT